MRKSFVYFQAIIVLSCLLGCNQQTDFKYEQEYHTNGNFAYKFTFKEGEVIEIGLYPDSSIAYVFNWPKDYGQLISFDDEGVMMSKVKLGKDSLAFGRSYYFHGESGNLHGDFNFDKGIKKGVALTYFDISTDKLESIMYYNDEGELVHRRTFDEDGKVIKEEYPGSDQTADSIKRSE